MIKVESEIRSNADSGSLWPRREPGFDGRLGPTHVAGYDDIAARGEDLETGGRLEMLRTRRRVHQHLGLVLIESSAKGCVRAGHEWGFDYLPPLVLAVLQFDLAAVSCRPKSAFERFAVR